MNAENALGAIGGEQVRNQLNNGWAVWPAIGEITHEDQSSTGGMASAPVVAEMRHQSLQGVDLAVYVAHDIYRSPRKTVGRNRNAGSFGGTQRFMRLFAQTTQRARQRGVSPRPDQTVRIDFLRSFANGPKIASDQTGAGCVVVLDKLGHEVIQMPPRAEHAIFLLQVLDVFGQFGFCC